MRWNEIPAMSHSRGICRDISLEKQLNKKSLLKEVYQCALDEIGLTSSQAVSNQFFFDKLGHVIISFALEGRIDKQKVMTLIQRSGEADACECLGMTVVCLMEEWGLIKGGPRIQ
jgi:hypothetical protein